MSDEEQNVPLAQKLALPFCFAAIGYIYFAYQDSKKPPHLLLNKLMHSGQLLGVETIEMDGDTQVHVSTLLTSSDERIRFMGRCDDVKKYPQDVMVTLKKEYSEFADRNKNLPEKVIIVCEILDKDTRI